MPELVVCSVVHMVFTNSNVDNKTASVKMMKFIAGYSGTEGVPFARSASHIYDECFLEASS